MHVHQIETSKTQNLQIYYVRFHCQGRGKI